MRSWLVTMFSFRGALGVSNVLVPLYGLLAASLLVIFLIPIGEIFWIIFGTLVVCLVAVSVRRLRHAGLGWGWVLIGLIPFFGWATLAILLSKGKTGSPYTVALPQRVAVSVASFLTILLLSTSVSIKASNSEIGQATAGAWESQQEESQQYELRDEQEAAEPEATRIQEAKEAEAESLAQQEANGAVAQAAEVDPSNRGSTGGSFDEMVARLRVEPEFIGGYNRELFRHWIDESDNGCHARQETLIAESLTPVDIGPRCSLSGGSWYSHFDGRTFIDPSQLDVDHLVPLAEAWRSGAHEWDGATRDRFANDLDYSMSLIAVSASSNRSKGDKDPANWLPPNASFVCEYVYSWATVKVRWALAVDEAELATIKRAWIGCSEADLSLQ